MADKQRSGIENDGLDKELGALDQGPVSDTARRSARRRFLTGGLAGAPVILTLSSRPALATFCSASVGSGNMSQQTSQVTCRGRTPGYWKTHPDRCENYIVVGPCNPITNSSSTGTCDDYSVPTIQELKDYREVLNEDRDANLSKIRKVNRYIRKLKYYPGLDSPPFGAKFSEVFTSGLTEDPTTTIMQALWLDDTPPLPPIGSGGPAPILAHCAAGYLNACEFGREEYGYSHQELVNMVISRILTDPFGLKSDLEMLNERG